MHRSIYIPQVIIIGPSELCIPRFIHCVNWWSHQYPTPIRNWHFKFTWQNSSITLHHNNDRSRLKFLGYPSYYSVWTGEYVLSMRTCSVEGYLIDQMKQDISLVTNLCSLRCTEHMIWHMCPFVEIFIIGILVNFLRVYFISKLCHMQICMRP